MFPLYYGWFLHITDTKLLMEAARGMIERCLVITEVLSDIFERTGCQNMEDLVDHYSWLKSVHSTSRYDLSIHGLNISSVLFIGSHKEKTKRKSMSRRLTCWVKLRL